MKLLIPHNIPVKFRLDKPEHLKQLYDILRESANEELDIAQNLASHPDDIAGCRDNHRVLDAAARAVHRLLHKPYNA